MKLIIELGRRIQNLGRRAVRAKTVGVRALVFDSDNRVLLVKHTYREGWHTPGGAVNNGETPIDAVRREVLEETGVTLDDNIDLFAVYLNKWRNLDDFPILYVAKNQEGDVATNDRYEIAEVGWFLLDSLPEDTTQKTRRRIEEYLGNQAVSNTW
ncbi:NUDIX domain-containing protein [Hahella aquimaris]|uniref:NUDIX domain-containing protein n=1 Tax=Hahella sp. HNIBRBA332 TaxID=3015983 RepID=UPI00273AABFE|nr:NUDIX domain-containing protein [Hahella sp. HNIBRBA332]WLQ15965.1 NUDIX domain-containing protein [Hahella sp. HNIBRBA332]